MSSLIQRLVCSPCCNPELPLDEVLATYSRLGFRKFEAFTSWVASAFDVEGDPAFYLDKGRRCGMEFTSCHLPPVGDDLSIDAAVRAARFAKAIGADIVLFKATSRANYIRSAGRFLEAIDALGVTPVLQNHFGTPISSPEDFREVLQGVNDGRMKALLEVGHFHSAGVSWRAGCELLRGRMALVHIKDQVGPQSVPFGTGEIDLPGLFRHMRSVGYEGDYVVEMEVQDQQNTLQYLAEAIAYLQRHCRE